MCMCGKPTINGEPGYSWDGKAKSVRQPDPPELEDGDDLLFDEPGRCGGIDAHCHHYRVVKRHGQRFLLVRHGGGTERIKLSSWRDTMDAMLVLLDSNARFWFFNSLYYTISEQVSTAQTAVRNQWSRAFVDKRIKKQKRKGNTRVWIITDVPADHAVGV